MFSKTMKDQLKDTDQVVRLIKNGNALAEKLSEQLVKCRMSLEILRAFQPDDQFKVDVPYAMRTKNGDERASMREIIDRQVQEINRILGDRA